jgi:hypothetical protein
MRVSDIARLEETGMRAPNEFLGRESHRRLSHFAPRRASLNRCWDRVFDAAAELETKTALKENATGPQPSGRVVTRTGGRRSSY